MIFREQEAPRCAVGTRYHDRSRDPPKPTSPWGHGTTSPANLGPYSELSTRESPYPGVVELLLSTAAQTRKTPRHTMALPSSETSCTFGACGMS